MIKIRKRTFISGASMNQVHTVPLRLRAAYLAMHRKTNGCLAGLDITADQFVCLLILLENGAMIQRELASLASSDPNTLRAVLVLLERKGLVLRTPHKMDRRAWLVKLTAAGRARTRKAKSRLEDLHTILEREIPRSEQKQLASSLLKLSTLFS